MGTAVITRKKCRVHRNWYGLVFVQAMRSEEKTIKNIPERNGYTKTWWQSCTKNTKNTTTDRQKKFRGKKTTKLNKALIGFLYVNSCLICMIENCTTIYTGAGLAIFKFTEYDTKHGGKRDIQKLTIRIYLVKHTTRHTKYEQLTTKNGMLQKLTRADAVYIVVLLLQRHFQIDVYQSSAH